MAETAPGRFNIHHIAGMESGDFWGIPDMPGPIGVMRATAGEESFHITLVIDHDYAQMLTDTVQYLTGDVKASSSAVRWFRLDWPEEWPTRFEPNAWTQWVNGQAVNVEGDE